MSKSREDKLARRVEQRVVQATIQSFSGPLPHPDILKRYNDCIPNGAQRLIDMAEKQQIHRQGLEKKVIYANALDQRLGLVLGFLLAVCVAVGGFYLILLGKDGTGIASVVASIGGPAGIFIWGRRRQEKEREEKASSFPTFTR